MASATTGCAISLTSFAPASEPFRNSDSFIPEAFCHMTKMSKQAATARATCLPYTRNPRTDLRLHGHFASHVFYVPRFGQSSQGKSKGHASGLCSVRPYPDSYQK